MHPLVRNGRTPSVGSRRAGRVAVGCLLALLVACSGDDDKSSVLDVDAQPEEERCLAFDETVGAEVTSFPWTSCDVEHSHEMYYVAPYTEVPDAGSTSIVPDVYPGFAALESFAQRECLGAFEPYVGISAFDSKLFYSWLVPTLESWNNNDDFEVVCVAGNRDGNALTTTIRGSRR